MGLGMPEHHSMQNNNLSVSSSNGLWAIVFVCLPSCGPGERFRRELRVSK